MRCVAIALALSVAAGAAAAQATPAGLWKTIDDETRQEKSHVRITDQGGVLTGKIEKLLDPAKQDPTCSITDQGGVLTGKIEKLLDPAKQDPTCEKCTDERKGQPVLGMTILRNVKANGEVWDGGDILDPNNGKVYRVRLKPEDGGKRLEVRGYIGPFYRNQHWIRVE